MSDYKEDCPLCTMLHKETFRVVEENDKAYSLIPFEPQIEGHILVLPKRHATLAKLDPDDLVAVRDLTVKIKNRLVKLFPDAHPFVYTVTDTVHATVPQHFHYHIMPTKVDVRVLFAAYYPDVPVKKRVPNAELERMANLIKEGA